LLKYDPRTRSVIVASSTGRDTYNSAGTAVPHLMEKGLINV
jgi:hypothetical protein